MKSRLRSKIPAITMIGPTTLWLVVFLVLPLALVIGISFLSRNGYGGVDMKLSLAAYTDLLSFDYLKVFGSSFQLSFITTVICLLVGYPFAFIISELSAFDNLF